MKSFEEYRSLAAECLRLAATTDDANSHAQYTALAEMWTALAHEAETGSAIFGQPHAARNEAQIVQQQEQVQPEQHEQGEKD